MTEAGTRTLLLVEDDPQLSGMLEQLLAGEGYAVTVAPDGQAGLHLGLTRAFDVLVIDRGLPAIDGLDLLGRLRGRSVRSPALILTARGTLTDRVAGLDAGAQDYLVKPFEVDELLARLRALVRRHADLADALPFGTGRLDLIHRRVQSADGTVVVELTERECALLRMLVSRPARVFTRDELFHGAFGDAERADSAVDACVHYLRRKLGRQAVATVHGVGYRAGTW